MLLAEAEFRDEPMRAKSQPGRGVDSPADVVAVHKQDCVMRKHRRHRGCAGRIQGFACFVGDSARVNFDELQSDDLAKSFENNFIGPILLAKEVAEHMIAQNVEGSLVLLSSMQAVGLFERSLNYAAPKASLIHACRILAKQWSGKHNLRINIVAPGATVVGMAASSIGSGKYDGFIQRQDICRFGQPEDVARAVRFLLEPDSYVTGQVIVVDGGLSLKA